jgi:hypothetical protein
MASDWPSENYAFLMGKVTGLTRIQWEDGATSALIDLATRKRVIGRDGNWIVGWDFHQVEVSPGETVFKTTWPGAIIRARGEMDTFPWRPHGSKRDVRLHVLIARGYQVVIPSPQEQTVPRTVLRNRRTRAERASAGHTEDME